VDNPDSYLVSVTFSASFHAGDAFVAERHIFEVAAVDFFSCLEGLLASFVSFLGVVHLLFLLVNFLEIPLLLFRVSGMPLIHLSTSIHLRYGFVHFLESLFQVLLSVLDFCILASHLVGGVSSIVLTLL